MAGGLLYWPFEDARFSTGRGEYMVTDGARWRWARLPAGEVFHVHAIAASHGTLYAATSAWRAGVYAALSAPEDGAKLLRLAGDGVRSVASWPSGRAVDALTAYRGHVYAVNVERAGTALWRTDGHRTERVTALDGYRVRALAADQDRLWVVTAREAGGALWRSTDGHAWTRAQGVS